MTDPTRSDRSRAWAARLVLAIRDSDTDAVARVLAEADRHPRGLFDLAVAAATLASAHISADEAATIAAKALDQLATSD